MVAIQELRNRERTTGYPSATSRDHVSPKRSGTRNRVWPVLVSTPASPAAWFTMSAYARPPALTTCASQRWNPAPFDATESSRAVCEKMSGLGVRRVPFGDSSVARVACWDGINSPSVQRSSFSGGVPVQMVEHGVRVGDQVALVSGEHAFDGCAVVPGGVPEQHVPLGAMTPQKCPRRHRSRACTSTPVASVHRYGAPMFGLGRPARRRG